MPYSCQLQLGTSGSKGTPVGAGSTWRAIGLEMSQTSRLTMVQTIMRAPPGNFSGGRSTMAEYSVRSRGSMGPVMAGYSFDLGKQEHHAALDLRDASPSSAITSSVFITKPN